MRGFWENIIDIMKKYISLIALLLCVQVLFAVDKSYYSTYVDNKSGATLFTGIHNVAKVGYSSLSYSGLWTAYATTDVYPSGHIYAGKIWDMYGGCEFTYGSSKTGGDQCGSYSVECDCYNREHSIPKSWFGGTEANNTPGSDIFHVVPTDGKVNGMRSNYAFGEVNSASYSYNGSKLGTPKSITIANTLLGNGEVTKSCSGSTVFEPIDEYKGDFARGYFGTMLRWASGDYQTFTTDDGALMFNTAYDAAHYYGLTQYGLALLLKWHRQDPVSQKEIDRNNGIQTTQGNRNPFIDYPILAEYLWGKYAGQTFSLANAVGSFEAGFTPGVSDGDNNSGTPAVTYTVSWMANGSSFATSTTRPDDPNNCSDTRVFRGWTGTKNYSGDNAPLDLFTTGNPTITKDTTFYAVYADKSTSGSGTSTSVELIGEFNGQGTSGTGSEMTATKSGVTLTFSKAFGASATVIRAYAGGTLTFTSSNPITQISFTTNSQKGNAEDVALTNGGGSYSATGTSGAWTGSSTSIVFSNSQKQVQFTGITVTVGSSTTTYSNFSLSCSNSTPTDEAFPGAAPEGYYDAIEGLSDSILKSTLGALTYANFTIRYSYGSGNHNTWHALWSTDRDESDNSVIDMYSNNKRYFNPSDTTASVAGCDIEHMFPNSWWGGKAGNRDAYEDLHHLVPADYSANRSKSNHGPGEPTTITFNNGVWINGNDANRGNIVVFCPSDEYKGDFARAFFYIATTYGDTAVWQKEGITAGHHMTNDSWKEFLPEMSELLLKWHRQDPVSDKERIRMNKVYEIQGNRNPFIDYPCLAEYIWGEKQGQTVNLSNMASAYDAGFFDEGCVATTDPTIIDPTAAQYIGITKADSAITKQIKVRGINLTSGNLTLTLSGANASLFSLSANSISSTDAAKGKVVTISYTPTSNGEHSATLTISGCGVTSHEINLTATCSNLYTATWKVEDEQVLQTKAFSGQMPFLSDEPADCNANRVFVGWTAQTSVTDLPADLFRDEAPSLTENKTFYAVFADEDKHLDTKGHQDYKFSSNKWAASPSNWINGRSGYAYSSDKGGVQVSMSVSGAYATAPITFTNVDTIKVNYCTNPSSGAGSITMYVGEESITKTVDKTGGATLREVLFDFAATRPSGEVVISVECTTNSIYIDSVTVSYSAPATYSGYGLLCQNCTPVEPNASFASNEKSTTCGGAVSNALNKGGSDGTVTYTSSNTNVATVNGSTGEVTIEKVGTTVITANIAASGCYTETSASYTLTVNPIETTTAFSNPTTSLEEKSSVTNVAETTSDGTIAYSSDNTAVATVNASTGEVTAVKPGTARITASVAATDCYGASSAYYDLTVTAIPTYTVTWKANGVIVQTDHVQRDASYNLPSNPADCSEDRVFKGWTTAKNYEHATTAPEDMFNSSLLAPILTQDTTIYSVYADKESMSVPGETVYAKITNTDDLEDGQYLIISEGDNTHASVAFNGSLATLDAVGDTINVSISDNTIASSTAIDAATFTLTSITGGYTIQSASGYYIGQNSDANGLATSPNEKYVNTISVDGEGNANIISSGGAYLRYNRTSNQVRFRYYKSTSYSNQQPIQLYKKFVTGGTETIYVNYSTRCNDEYDFKALAATEVTNNSFVANWTKAAGDSYTLDVTKDVKTQQETTIFDKDFTVSLEGWTIHNVSGYEKVWTHNTTYGAYATSYVNKERNEAESWLLSPVIDLTEVTSPSLTLNHVFRYGTSVFLKIKEESAVEWDELSPTNWSAASNWDFVNSVADLSSYAGKNIQVGFKYVGTTDACPTWEIKRIAIMGTTEVDDFESISGYPREVSGTSALVSGLDPKTTYYYTVTSEEGIISNRIEVTTLESFDPTNTENIINGLEVRKLLIHGQLFILVGDQLFDITGKRVR